MHACIPLIPYGILCRFTLFFVTRDARWGSFFFSFFLPNIQLHLFAFSSYCTNIHRMATTSSIEVSAQTSSPQLSWNMPSSNSNNGRSSTLHLHDNDSRRTIQSPSPTARNSRASSIYNELCDKMSFASHSKKIAAKPFHLYTKYSQSLLLENTASVARDHLGK